MVKKCPGISKAFPAADTATGGTVVRRDPRTRDSTLRAGSGRNHENPLIRTHTHTHVSLVCLSACTVRVRDMFFLRTDNR